MLGLLGYLFPAELAGLLEGLEGLEGFGGFEAWQTAGSNALTREGYVQAKGRLQCWNADGQELGRSWQTAGSNAEQERAKCRQRAGCNAGTLTARSLVEAAARDVQAKGRLQPWNSKG